MTFELYRTVKFGTDLVGALNALTDFFKSENFLQSDYLAQPLYKRKDRYIIAIESKTEQFGQIAELQLFTLQDKPHLSLYTLEPVDTFLVSVNGEETSGISGQSEVALSNEELAWIQRDHLEAELKGRQQRFDASHDFVKLFATALKKLVDPEPLEVQPKQDIDPDVGAGIQSDGQAKRGPTLRTQERFRVFSELKAKHPTWSQAKVAFEAYEDLGEVTAETVRNTYRSMGVPWERGDRIR